MGTKFDGCKTVLCAMLAILMFAISFGGCKQRGSISTLANISESSDISVLNEYKSILQNKAEFFSVDANKSLNISNLNQLFSADSGISTKVIKFAVIDLDKDNIPEVVLWLSVNGDNNYGFEVLHYQDGEIFGYLFWYRAFYELKADGTFWFSGGAADNGFGTIKFIKNAYSIDKISYSISSYDSHNNISVPYIVNQKNATKEEFDADINKQNNKPNVPWYDFSASNIEMMFAVSK